MIATGATAPYGDKPAARLPSCWLHGTIARRLGGPSFMSFNTDLRIEPLDAPRHWRLIGDLDLASAPALESYLEPAFSQPGNLTLHAGGLTFVDSSGIRSLIRLSLRLGENRLIIVKPSPNLKRLFDLTGIRKNGRIDLRDTDCCVPE